MENLSIDLTDLEDKWSRTCHDACCDCGMNFEENDENPLLLWRNADNPKLCVGLALCWKCGEKRMGSKKKKGK